MGRLIGVTVRRYNISGLYEAWRQMYEEDLERLERLGYEGYAKSLMGGS